MYIVEYLEGNNWQFKSMHKNYMYAEIQKEVLETAGYVVRITDEEGGTIYMTDVFKKE